MKKNHKFKQLGTSCDAPESKFIKSIFKHKISIKSMKISVFNLFKLKNQEKEFSLKLLSSCLQSIGMRHCPLAIRMS